MWNIAGPVSDRRHSQEELSDSAPKSQWNLFKILGSDIQIIREISDQMASFGRPPTSVVMDGERNSAIKEMPPHR